MKNKPLLVFVEGIDGSGKTTLINHLKNTLVHQGIITRDYTMMNITNLGVELRKIIVEEDVGDILRFTSQMTGVFYNLRKITEKETDAHVILIDRSPASILAYNILASAEFHTGKRMAMRELFDNAYNAFLKENKDRIYNVFLDTPIKVCRERILKSRGSLDVMESKGEEYMKQVLNGYSQFYMEFFDGSHPRYYYYNTVLDPQAQTIQTISRVIRNYVTQQQTTP
jgi:thymidylate kinase